MVATAPSPGLEQAEELTGRDAARAMQRSEASHDQMEAQRIEAIAKGIGAPQQPLNLGIAGDGVYRFRSDVRKTSIYLRHPHQTGDVDTDVKTRKKFEMWASNEFGPTWKSQLKMDEKLWDKGIRMFEFKEVAGQHESWFETKDATDAAYIRSRLNEPGMQHIYEEARPMFATLPDGTQIEVTPTTRDGQIAAANAQAMS